MDKIETFTSDDLDKLRALESRRKRVIRQRKMIISAIDEDDELRNQVIEHLQHTDRVSDIAKLYGTNDDTLFTWLSDPVQIKSFKAAMRQAEASSDRSEEVIAEDELSPSDSYTENNSYHYE